MKKLLFFTLLFFVIIYYFSSPGTTGYDYFTRLSEAFLHGKFYLDSNPPWLNELIPINGKYYVPYPPMPAILATPFVLLIGHGFEQQYLAHILGAGIVVLVVAISKKIKNDNKLAIWSGGLTGFSTILWFMSSVGSAWYLGQISAAFFMTLAIYIALSHKKALFTGIFIGCAYLARLHTILALPLFLYLYREKRPLRNYLLIFLGVAPFVLFDFFYNYSRFGVIWDKGYILIPGVLDESWYTNGLFSPSYIPRHLKVIFGALPKFIEKAPYVVPSWEGLAIWLTTPAFVYAFFARSKKLDVFFSWVSIALISLVIFSHGTTGFIQFGYRYAFDFYPILLLLTIKSVAKTGVKWHHWILLLLGILVNAWGVIWINKFGWVV